MSRTQSLIFFIVAFIFNTLTFYFRASATDIDKHGALEVLMGGVAFSLGSIALPCVLVAIWGLVVFIRKNALPANFITRFAQLAAVFLIGSAFTELIS
jgi:hypothetical protein